MLSDFLWDRAPGPVQHFKFSLSVTVTIRPGGQPF